MSSSQEVITVYPHLSMLYATYVMKDPTVWTMDKVPAMIRDDVQRIVDEMAKKEQTPE